MKPILLFLSFLLLTGCSPKAPDAQTTTPSEAPPQAPNATPTPSPTAAAAPIEIGNSIAADFDGYYFLGRVREIKDGTVLLKTDSTFNYKSEHEVPVEQCEVPTQSSFEIGELVFVAHGMTSFNYEYEQGVIKEKAEYEQYVVAIEGSEQEATVHWAQLMPFKAVSQPRIEGQFNGQVEPGSVVAAPLKDNLILALVTSVEAEKVTVDYATRREDGKIPMGSKDMEVSTAEFDMAQVHPLAPKEWKTGDKVRVALGRYGRIEEGTILDRPNESTYRVSVEYMGDRNPVAPRFILDAAPPEE